MRDLAPLVGRRLDESTVDLIVERMYPAVASGQTYSRRLARQYYTDMVAEHVLGEPAPAPPPGNYDRPALRNGLVRVLLPDGKTPVTAGTLGRALAVGGKHILDSGRREMMATVLHDERFSGWARSDPSPPTCAFCTMLISRGAVYRSQETAGAMNQWHTHCSCQAVPVVNGVWEGRNQYEAADRLWRESAGHTDQLNTFRRTVGHADIPAAHAAMAN